MRKKWLIILSSVTLSGTFPLAAESLKDGTYPGRGQGLFGLVQVAVVVEDGRIGSIEVVREKERRPRNALTAIPARIARHQSTDVDAVSGATHTSQAVMDAVKDALKQAL